MSESAPAASGGESEIEKGSDGKASRPRKARASKVALEPTLTAYFGAQKVSPNAFIKAVTAARLAQFSDADLEDARTLAVANDTDGARLWALISSKRLPEPLKSWVWPEAKEFVKRVLGPEADLTNASAEAVVELIKKRFPLLTTAKVKIEHNTLIYTTRIVMTWFLTKKRIEPWPIAGLVARLICKNESGARETTLASLLRGSIREFRLVAALASMGTKKVEDRETDNARLRDENSALRQNLESRAAELKGLAEEIQAARAHAAELTVELQTLNSRMQSERQHSGHRLVSAKADNANRLRDLRALVQDAIDALELHTPAPDVASMRLRQAISNIEEPLNE